MRSRWLLLGLAIPLLLAATSGGFPSRPTVQKLTIAGTDVEKARLVSRDLVGDAWIGFYDSSNVIKGYLGYTSGSTDLLELHSVETGNIVFSTNGVARLTLDGSTNSATFPGAVTAATATIGGANVPKIVFGNVRWTGAVCNSDASYQQYGIAATCSRSSAGLYTVAISGVTFASTPVCQGNADSSFGATHIVGINATSATSISVRVENAAGAAADATVLIMCVGF